MAGEPARSRITVAVRSAGADRASIWRRDPDGHGADDGRVVGRMPREDDRVIGRAPRYQGPLTIFPFPNDW